MFAVKIEVWPYGGYVHPVRHTTIVAANDGTGSPYVGNYQAITVDPEAKPAEQRRLLLDAMDDGTATKVTGFPRGRDQGHLPSLTVALIEALGLNEIHADWKGAA